MTPAEAAEAVSKAGPMVIDDVLYGKTDIVMAWVQDELGLGPADNIIPQAFAILPPEEDAQARVLDQISKGEKPDFLAGCYFFNYRERQDIEVCVAVADIRASHPRVIRKILEYPFKDLDLPRISASIHKSNERALEQAIKLGFEVEGEKRISGVKMLGLYRDTCWIWNNVKEAA